MKDPATTMPTEVAPSAARPHLVGYLDLLPLGACMIDRELVVHCWNRRLAEWTGLLESQMIGVRLSDHFPELKSARFSRRLLDVFDQGAAAVFSSAIHGCFLRVPARDGTRGQMMVQQTQVRLLSRESKLAMVTMLDVTSESLQLQALRRERGELGQHVAARTRELAEANLSLRESERRYRFLADAMPQIVWTCKPDGVCDYVNQRFPEFSGIEARVLVENGWKQAIHPDDLPMCVEKWRESVRSGAPYEFEYRMRRAADGSYRWMLARAEAMRDETGAILQWVGTSTDIDDYQRAARALREAHDQLESRVLERTAQLASANAALQTEIVERKHAEEELLRYALDVEQARARIEQQAAELTNQACELRDLQLKAEQANRAKSEFLANMSHEIRTPINGVVGMTELILGTALSPEQREYAELIKVSAESLLTVINDILDFSKIEAGKLDLDPRPFSLRTEVGNALKPLSLRAAAKQLELVLQIAPNVPDCLIGDSGRIRQILVNLIGNAVKFTATGEIGVRIDQVERDNRGCRLHIRVQDTGIGISPEKQAAVFQPFEQADTSTTRNFGGTGLGLAISTRLVGMMGGRIWVESEPDVGSTFQFTVTLPIGESQAAVPSVAAAGNRRALVVDDNARARSALAELLAHHGWEVREAIDGASAQDAITRQARRDAPLDLMLVDASLAGESGFSFIEVLDAELRRRTTIVMLLSSVDRQNDLARCRGLGIAHLHKPILEKELLALLLTTQKPAGELPDGRDGAAAAGAAPTGLRILLAEDHLINQKVAVRLLERGGHSVVVANNGREMVEHYRTGKFDLILTDIQMPEMDGFEALNCVRGLEAEHGGRLPIIALTAHAMKGDAERCLQAGFDGYLSKPIRPAELTAALQKFGCGNLAVKACAT